MASNGFVMGFDFGTKKIGVAVGQAITGTATPLTILKARDGIPNWQQVEKIIREWQPALLVVGLPLNMDGTPSEMSRLSEKFARKLHGRYNIPSRTMDERLSSFEAALMTDQEGPIDSIAAQLILETYFREAE
jgi:putative Holliday junction resolvase